MQLKTDPHPHQRHWLPLVRDEPAKAIFWVPRAGKAWLTLVTAAHLYLEKKITGLLILVPRGAVRDVWVEQQIPDHLPDEVPRTTLAYRTGNTKRQQRELERLLDCEGLAVLVMTYHTFKTQRGQAAALQFLLKRETFYVLDESHWIKTPGSQTSKKVLAVQSKKGAKNSKVARPWLAPYRWILTGTPATAGAFDMYAQMRFLNPDIWVGQGWRTFAAFKSYFGVFERGHNYKTGKDYDDLKGYRHVDQLRKIVRPYISRVTEDDLQGMPEKLYTTYKFDLAPEQRRVYDELEAQFRTEVETELAERGTITATTGIVRAMRLHQISCGYVRDDTGRLLRFDPNPRLELLGELVSDLPEDHPVIVWCAHHPEIDAVGRRLTQLFGRDSWAQADGRVSEDDQKEAMRRFTIGEARFIVATQALASEGLDFRVARTVYYYSNSRKLRERLQSENRAIAVGKKAPVHYVDLVGRNTVDSRILRTYRANMDLQSAMLGDRVRGWFDRGAA